VRHAALSFVEGTRTTWRAQELATWCRDHLLASGYLSPWNATTGLIITEGQARLEIPLRGDVTTPLFDVPSTKWLLSTARERVLAGLSQLLATPADDRFVRAAVYTGRVRRVTEGRSSSWRPCLREGELLSCWVLGLFAADVLAQREVYDELFGICEVCGAVSIRVAAERRRCAAHATASRSSRQKIRNT
jgi:hypothetical protein